MSKPHVTILKFSTPMWLLVLFVMSSLGGLAAALLDAVFTHLLAMETSSFVAGFTGAMTITLFALRRMAK